MAALLPPCMSLAEEVHVRSVSPGSSGSVVFSTAEQYPVWRLHVKAAGYPDCKHKPGTQSPNNANWGIVYASGEWYKWKCAILPDNSELYFQQRFTGELICTNAPTVGGGGSSTNDGAWTINGKLDDYRVIPEQVTVVEGQITNFYAYAGVFTNISIPSEWSLAVTNDETNVNPPSLPDGSSVSFSIGESGSYTLTGQAVDEGGQPVGGASDTAQVHVLGFKLDMPPYLGVNMIDPTNTPVDSQTAKVTMDDGTPLIAGASCSWSLSAAPHAAYNPAPSGSTAPIKEIGVPSGSYQEEQLDVVVSGSGYSVTLQTNFTVVVVDIVMQGRDETDEETTGAFVCYNGDDDNTNGVPDVSEMSVTNEDDLVELTIELKPNGLPPEETVTITTSSGINLYEDAWKQTNAVACYAVSNFPLNLWAEGVTVSTTMTNEFIETKFDLATNAQDRVNLTIIKVDLDIDSDNNNDLEDPVRSPAEDELEDEPGHPGKALALNHLDRDKDGIPDFADGFDIEIGGVSQAAADASHDFVPVIFEFSENIDTNTATVKFSSDFLSNPATDVSRTGGGTKGDPFGYNIAGAGRVRLWRGKNGSESRLKASVTAGGDAILKDEDIPLASLSPSDGVVHLYLEALKRSDALGDIQLKVELNPTGSGVAADYICSDLVKATVFGVDSVRPIAEDFVTGHEGKIMISTKHCTTNTPNRVYTSAITTKAGTPAQHHSPDGSHNSDVTATACVTPVPPEELTGFPDLTVYFEVIDPDDQSPYDGKVEPSDPTNQWPNDNLDPEKRMIWGETGCPEGYEDFQAACLTAREATATLVTIDGIQRYAAETILKPTDRYAGDNYQVRATLRKPDYSNEFGRFDTHTGMNTNNTPYVFHASTIKETISLVSWKRVYIEYANMYKKGATIISTESLSATHAVFEVSSKDDLDPGAEVVIFWKDDSVSCRVESIDGAWPPYTLTVVDFGSAITDFPQWAGIRIPGENETYDITTQLFPQAYGLCAQGTDGGAFVEFRDLSSESSHTGKMRFPHEIFFKQYYNYWFRNMGQENVRLLAASSKVEDSPGLIGAASVDKRWGAILCANTNIVSSLHRDKCAVHELGHTFLLVNRYPGDDVETGASYFPHIDLYTGEKQSHEPPEYCIMDYNSVGSSSDDAGNGKAEFSIDCLIQVSDPVSDPTDIFGGMLPGPHGLRTQKDF